ncbi:hypothetical protein [Aestuariivirga sp.]|uniref:hypothetical protein n=1 Tax=Aestuariivirga sp. TaxID=2650926 RepID=UPI0039E6B6FF
MIKLIPPTAIAAILLSAIPAFANDTVNFTMTASQPSLRDNSLKDTFAVGLSDPKVITEFKLTCEGAQGGIISSTDETCAVTGNGALINPSNGQKLQRTQYSGGWIVKSDGFTDGAQMAVNYLALGKVPASSGRFSGSMMLKPENPSTTATLLRDSILKKIKSTNTGLIDERVDTIQFNNFTVPSAGLPSEKGCVWNGDMVYSYQTESWFMDVSTKCSGKEYKLKGNMPFTETPNVGNQHQYDLTLTLPSGDESSDDALFVKPTGDADLFAAADGISGQIIMKESAYVDVDTDGQTDKVASQIEATGSLTGQNVSLEAVRSLGVIIGVLSRTFFGA